ncbi:hypothetical protein [Kutzneria sp. NPDC052558]|uniref:hypothetical protein n=1 Tax=Kutzneria sp. NPDC052558 TaxID=3364121 RepID=UPI0037CAD90F
MVAAANGYRDIGAAIPVALVVAGAALEEEPAADGQHGDDGDDHKQGPHVADRSGGWTLRA